MNDSSPPVVVPRLATERLLLRELRAGDFDAYAEHMADPVATEHLSGVITRRMAWRLFCGLSGSWMLHDAGWWGIELRETGAVIGIVGAFFRETSLQLGAERELELGWSLYRPFWRRGYAREAAAAALAHGLGRHPVARAIAHVAAANAASIGVTRAIGMSYDGVVDFYGEPSNRYAVERAALEV